MAGTKDPRFNENEKDFLISLVKKHEKVIECKTTNKTKSETKDVEWEVLGREWNARYCKDEKKRKQEGIIFDKKVHIHQRPSDKLKKGWTNLKNRAKEEVKVTYINFKSFHIVFIYYMVEV